jgi:hypothetical protein
MKKLKKAEDGVAMADRKKQLMQEGREQLKKSLTPISDKVGKVSLSGKTLSEYEKMYAPKKKMGGMIKRADGSYSKRGLWDNIRANKGSGKKPTAQMLKQEKKIKAQTKKK